MKYPLHYSAKNGHVVTVKRLIRAGADIDAGDWVSYLCNTCCKMH